MWGRGPALRKQIYLKKKVFYDKNVKKITVGNNHSMKAIYFFLSPFLTRTFRL
jgi:hypothetical protein